VPEDDADRGALVAQPETPASLSRLAVRRHDPRQEPGAVVPLAGICAGGGEQSPSLPRRAPGMARSAMDGAGNRKAKADREVTWG
jgi:hypothetical protein